MSHNVMSDLSPKSIETAEPKASEHLATAQKKLGFIPNMYANMANAPHLLATYLFGYEQFRSESGLTPAEQEVVLLTISRHNKCSYCMAAHSMLADNVSKVPSMVTQAIRDGAEIDDAKLRALSELTRTILKKQGWLDSKDVDAFLQAGFQQSHILDVLLAISVKTISNYANHLFDTPVDDMFKPHEWQK